MSIRWTYAFVDRPADRVGAARDFWTAVTGTGLSEFRGARDEFVTLLPSDGDACVKVQGVEAGAGGAHLDFSVADVGAFAAVARDLGAVPVAEHVGWCVLRSPAGLLFCAVPWHGEAVRPAVVDGSRLDQVCLDIPPSAYDAECAFWAGLTGWEPLTGSLPEFRVLRPPPGLPVRILLQRLRDERPATAHPDLACADVAAVLARHEVLGAAVVAHGPHWTVLRDPAGGLYCLTRRDPETGGPPAPGVSGETGSRMRRP
ncbi:VOC family protein [Streptomyces sp. NPDC002514]|uniref:VOC family protein n=1 Tax=Streptomyces sp. NPDC001270 TaxID=3364554 RepID=UPI0036CCA3DD